MHIEEQVVSYDLSKKLKELGVSQKSMFWHKEFAGKENIKSIRSIGFCGSDDDLDFCSAFSVAELMDMLPAFIDTKMDEPFNNFYLEVCKRTAENIQYLAVYVCDSMPGDEINNPMYKMRSKLRSHDSKLADCLAKILILVIENGFFNK